MAGNDFPSIGGFTSTINMRRLFFGGALRRGLWKFRLKILTYP